jgi:quinol monooxygenase YgiN
MIAPTRAEPGNLLYDLWRESDGPRRFILDELYVDEAAIASHRQSAHFRDYFQQIGDMADREAIVMTRC